MFDSFLKVNGVFLFYTRTSHILFQEEKKNHASVCVCAEIWCQISYLAHFSEFFNSAGPEIGFINDNGTDEGN